MLVVVAILCVAGSSAASVYLDDFNDLFTAANGSLARIGNCSAGFVVQNTTLSGVQCVAVNTGDLLGNLSSGFLPEFWNGSLRDSPIEHIIETDEEYISIFNKGLYFDYTNGVGGINVPSPESHQATWSVNTIAYAGIGSIATTTYDAVLDTTEMDVQDLVLMPSLGSASTIFVGLNRYYVDTVVDVDTISIRGNWTGANAISTSTWSYKQAPYLDVNGVEGDEKGISFSTNGQYFWSMYVPDQSNDTQLCFTTNDFGDAMCLDDQGNVVFTGNVSASNFVGGSSGNLNGSGTINTLPMWTGSGSLGDSPAKVTYGSETEFSIWDILAVEEETGAVFVNKPVGAYGHESALAVSTIWKNGSTILTTGAYNAVDGYTVVTSSGLLPKELSWSTRVRSGAGPYDEYFVDYWENRTVIGFRGNYTGANAVTLTQWEYKQAPYVEVNGDPLDEQGYAWSINGAWKWAAYIPDDSNNTQLCFQSSQFSDTLCLYDDGNVRVNGILSALTSDLKKYSGSNTFGHIVSNGDGSVNISSETVTLYSDASGDSPLYTSIVAGGRTGVEFAALAEGVNYVWIDYNNGTPEFVVNADDAYGNFINILPHAVVTREGNLIITTAFKNTGNALAEKMSERIYRLYGISRESGLALSEGTNRSVKISEGFGWYGPNRLEFEEFDSINATMVGEGPQILDKYIHVGGSWTELRTRQYDNLYYDDGTDIVLLGDGNYTVNWIYRTEDNVASPSFAYAHIVLGDAQYETLEAARLAQPRIGLPEELVRNSLLVGRMIVRKNANTSDVSSTTTLAFTGSSVSNHNDLIGIQGGESGDYYHLTQGNYTNVITRQWEQQAFPGTCAVGTVVQNTTTSGVQCVSVSAASGLARVSSLNSGIIAVQNSTDVNLTLNMTYVLANAQGLNNSAGIAALNLTKGAVGTCAVGYVVQNVTNTSVQCTNVSSLTGELFAYVSSELVTTSNTVWSALPTLTMQLESGHTYIYECALRLKSDGASSGAQLQVNTTGAPSSVQMSFTGMASTSAMQSIAGTSTSSNTFSSTGTSTQYGVNHILAYVVTSGSASTVTVALKSELSGTASYVGPGSYCSARQVA